MENKITTIDPQKTSVYMDVKHIKNMRGLIALGVLKKEDVNIKKLLNTVQYLHEVIKRMEDHDAYVMAILTKKQINQLMREQYGWTDEDFEKSRKNSLEILDKLKKKLNE